MSGVISNDIILILPRGMMITVKTTWVIWLIFHCLEVKLTHCVIITDLGLTVPTVVDAVRSRPTLAQ